MPHDLTYIELKDALAQPGCALCRLGERYGQTYLRWLLLERVNDLTTRITLAQSWGFCVSHAWMLQEMEWERDKDGMGTAILWEWLIERYRIHLAQSLETSDALQQRLLHRWRRRQRSRLAAQLLLELTPQGLCPACASQRQSEEYALGVLTQHLAEEAALRVLYRQSGGLCMPHFTAALKAAQVDEVVHYLVEVQLETLTRCTGELHEYLRKHDPRFSQEPYGSEMGACIRATELLAGQRPHTGACETLECTSQEVLQKRGSRRNEPRGNGR
jgi:hypothetical protein